MWEYAAFIAFPAPDALPEICKSRQRKKGIAKREPLFKAVATAAPPSESPRYFAAGG